MSHGQARAGLRQVKRLEANLAHRRHMTEVCHRLLADHGWPELSIPDHMDPILVRYPVRVRDKPGAVSLAARNRVELGTWFESPIHQAIVWLVTYDYHDGMCRRAEQACNEMINLPLHRRTGESHARRGVELLQEIGRAE